MGFWNFCWSDIGAEPLSAIWIAPSRHTHLWFWERKGNMANICFDDIDWRLWHFLHNLRHSRCFLGLNQTLYLGASFVLRQNLDSEGLTFTSLSLYSFPWRIKKWNKQINNEINIIDFETQASNSNHSTSIPLCFYC